VLAVVTFVAFAAAALAVVGWLIPNAWWTGLVFTGVVGSTLLLVLLFAPTLVFGFVINADLVALAIQTAWEVAERCLPPKVRKRRHHDGDRKRRDVPRLADRTGLTTLPSGSAPSSYCGTDRTAQTAEALVNNWLTQCSGAHTMRFEAAR
jgi:hypothetical protein